MSIKTSLLLSNVSDLDHQKCHLVTNKGQFASTLWGLNEVIANASGRLFYSVHITGGYIDRDPQTVLSAVCCS